MVLRVPGSHYSTLLVGRGDLSRIVRLASSVLLSSLNGPGSIYPCELWGSAVTELIERLLVSLGIYSPPRFRSSFVVVRLGINGFGRIAGWFRAGAKFLG